MGVYFGTDGIRGEIFKDITPELIFRIGNALVKGKNELKILVGRDTRNSGELLLNSLNCGIISGGGAVYNVGVITTPGVAFLTRKFNFDYGIMITASHNSSEFNGIKIFNKYGEKISEEEENEIEKKSLQISYCDYKKIGRIINFSRIKKEYISFLENSFSRKIDLKIVLDCANGASGRIAGKVFRDLGADVVVINRKSDGLSINEKCGALHPDVLVKKVLKKKANLGLAFDGDADRLVVVDDNGNIFDGDNLIYLFAKFFKRNGILKNNTIVVTEMSNKGLDVALGKSGITTLRTNVGDKYVSQKMKDGYMLGGEQCGHIILGNNAMSGDGILAGILLANILTHSNLKLSEIRKFKPFFQFKSDFLVKNKNIFLENDELKKFVTDLGNKINDEGRILLRASGTENKIRLLVESKEKKRGEDIFKQLEQKINNLM